MLRRHNPDPSLSWFWRIMRDQWVSGWGLAVVRQDLV